MSRSGEYAVITGGNRGIGWFVVQGLVTAGMKVIVGKSIYDTHEKRLILFSSIKFQGCRDGKSREDLEEKLYEAGIPENTVMWVALDMSSMDSVKAFAGKIVEKNIPISILINNGETLKFFQEFQSSVCFFLLAGALFPPYSLTCDGFESQFAVNYLNHCLLTHMLLPQLIAAGKTKSSMGVRQASRIINLSSSLHAIGLLQLEDLQSRY